MCVRFGHDWDPACMQTDETLFAIQEKVKNFAVFYLVSMRGACEDCAIDTCFFVHPTGRHHRGA